MSASKKTLFVPVVDASRLHPKFKRLIELEEATELSRLMLDDVYQDFEDPDGNFLEQFQTAGFDSRYFELYLHAYLSRSGYDVDRSHPNPDFIVERDGVRVAIEATTANPRPTEVSPPKSFADMSAEELSEYMRNELAIRLGSPLYSKLHRKYWEQPHCAGLPFVLAIEDFHSEEAIFFSDSGLSEYLYGLHFEGDRTADGGLEIRSQAIEEHKSGSKTIPSGFFTQPDAENVSAVLFTNSGTHGKMVRMGVQHGYAAGKFLVVRTGTAYNPEPTAMDPTYFSYDLNAPPYVETWGSGLIVAHNPTAKNPLDRGFFFSAMDRYIENGDLTDDVVGFQPISSVTQTLFFKSGGAGLARGPRFAIHAISRDDFRRITGVPVDRAQPFASEDGWFTDDTQSFLGVTAHDDVDDDWSYVLLGLDEKFVMRPLNVESGFPTREKVVAELHKQMAARLVDEQRLFPNGIAPDINVDENPFKSMAGSMVD